MDFLQMLTLIEAFVLLNKINLSSTDIFVIYKYYLLNQICSRFLVGHERLVLFYALSTVVLKWKMYDMELF